MRALNVPGIQKNVPLPKPVARKCHGLESFIRCLAINMLIIIQYRPFFK
ncbi:hypothetical protein GFK82_00402 [Candidatus Steffania adelgidicola]|nr:hypothetical protein GFK82_00402 [Candidatus Steffania adelgidicola]